MTKQEIQKLVRKKLFLVDCFLFNGSVALPEGKDAALKLGVANYYLSSIVMELLVKSLYELDSLEQAPFTHNILRLFETLKVETKLHFRQSYDAARKRNKEKFRTIDKAVEFPPLHQVLEANERFIKNFKYDAMGSRSNNSADGVFYKEIFELIAAKSSEL